GGALDEHHLRLPREGGHGAFLAARVARAAVAVGAVAAEAAEARRQAPAACRRGVLEREHACAYERVGEPGRLDERERDPRPRDQRTDARSPHARPRLTAGRRARFSGSPRMSCRLVLMALVLTAATARAQGLAELL